MTQYGVFITKSGKSVLQVQNPVDYIINSNYNTFKIYKEINVTIAVPSGGTGTKIVTHGLGYIPAFLAFYRLKSATAVWHVDGTALGTGDAAGESGGYEVGVFGYTQISKNEIKFAVKDAEGTGDQTVEVKAFILIEPIDLVPTTTPGALQTNGFGFKVSKPGVNVLTAKTHELLVSSKYDSLKFHMEKTLLLTITAGGTNGTISFQHGLGYVPIFMGTIQDYGSTGKQRIVPFGQAPQPEAVSLKANKSTITAIVYMLSAPFDVTFRFRVIVMKNKLSAA